MKDNNLPVIEYENTKAVTLFFLIDHKKAADLCGDLFLPVRYFFNKSLAFLSFYDNQKSDIGPYKEIAIGIKARFHERKEKGYYIFHLPVSTKIARDKGIKIWGFPKTLNKISVNMSEKSASISLNDLKMKNIFSLKTNFINLAKVNSKDITLFSIHKKRAVSSKLQVNGKSSLKLCRNYTISVSNQQEVTKILEKLNLHKKKPFMAVYAENKRSRLFKGKKI